MDVLYDNLDNYSEESTIAELREENKELKFKLEDYATALDKLQKEFDLLTSEHKKLELNYSSLLRTARSEIERKTQIISKLNIEKDAMVLNSIQNRNLPYNRRKDKEMNNTEGSYFGKPKPNVNSNEESWKPSLPNQIPNERRADSLLPSENSSSSVTNIQTKLLDMVNKSVGIPNINSAKNIEVNENIQHKDDAKKTRARICNRRKSMPAFSVDYPKFSTDEDEDASTGSSKELLSKEHSERRNLHRFRHDKPSMPDKMMGHYDPSRETQRRYSRQFDSDKYRSQDKYEPSQRYKLNHSPFRDRKGSQDKRRVSPDRRKVSPDRRKVSPDRRRVSPDRKRASPDRRRVSPDRKRASPDRRKGSSDKRRGSPDRYRLGIHDHREEIYQRQEYDRGRRLVSPPKEKYNDYKLRRRDFQRSNERNSQDFDRYKSRSQDKYTMKHKMLHDYEESSKRMRLDSHHKQEDRRQVVPELLNPDFYNMSCQSPEFNHFEPQASHQIKEIKFNASATAQLEDPRLSSKKYALKNYDGRLELCIVESANIDVQVVDTSGWELPIKMKMPDALLTKPVTTATLSDLLQKPMSSNNPVELLQKPVVSVMPHELLHHPTSNGPETLIQKQKAPDMPNTLDEPMNVDKSDNVVTKKPVTHALEQKPIFPKDKLIITELPDILTQKSMFMDDLVKEIYMDIENPISNMSVESGEIDDYDDSEARKRSDANTNEKFSKEKNIKLVVETQTPKNVLPKLNNNYKIPKNCTNNKQITKISKGLFLNKHNDNTKYNSHISGKINDNVKDTTEIAVESPRQNKIKVPKRRRSELKHNIKDCITAKDIIEGDLELSDETSDTDVQMKQTPISKEKEDKDKKAVSHDSTVVKTQIPKPDLFEADETNAKKTENTNFDENNKEIIVKDSKKPKTKKKSLKLKESIEPRENQDTALCIDKPGNNKENTIKEPSDDKDVSLSIDQLVKIKNKITKELSENKDTVSPIDKPVTKNEKTSKVPSKTKHVSISTEKLVKKKESKPKATIDSKDAAVSTNKPVKQKETKPKKPLEKKDTSDKPCKKKPKDTSENTEQAALVGNTQVNKTKNTKFNELFGDSSSLVSPEDLGLVPAVVPQENYVAIFEDALDAIDMNALRAPVATTVNTNNTFGKADAHSSFGNNIVSSKTPTNTVDSIQTTQEAIKSVRAEPTPLQKIYQNLQPRISPKEESVKTIIISTGTQSQCTTERADIVNNKSVADLHLMQCVKPTVIQDIAMQALATSTPHKTWQQNLVQAEKDLKIPNSRCEPNVSRETAAVTLAIENSNSTMNTSQTDQADEPDMTIFVKRRRRVIKKK